MYGNILRYVNFFIKIICVSCRETDGRILKPNVLVVKVFEITVLERNFKLN